MFSNLDSLFGQFALISPAHLGRWMGKINVAAPNLAHRLEDMEPDNEDGGYTHDIFGDKLPKPYMRGTVGVVPVKGVITSGLPKIFRTIGMADTEEITGWIDGMAADPAVTGIVLEIDSPGGMVMGTPELGDAVDAAAQSKPVIAHTRGMMDSAAYWIGSQADAIYCTPSADVGCIGVYQLHVSIARALEAQGIDVRLFKSGDLKATGHPAVEMSEDQAAAVQSEVDAIGATFRATVKSKRTMVSDDSMRGQSFIGTEAANRNLVAGLRSFDSLF